VQRPSACIFISYRRAHDAGLALLVRSAVEREFGKGSAFLDAQSIPPGDDYRWVIERAAATSAGTH
jgi:hypothetical protein